MTNQWDSDTPNTPIGSGSGSSSPEATGPITPSEPHFSTPPAEATHGEDTRIIPPQTEAAPHAPRAPRRTGVLTAAVLVGALVVGGSAGVGGAAIYESTRGSDQAQTSSGSGSGNSTASSVVDSTSSTAIEAVSKKMLPSVVQINVSAGNESGTGSGIILDSNGTILTNNHVVAVAGDNGTISVNFADGSTAKAKVVGTDPITDLAVIKAQGVSGLTAAKIGNSNALRVGEGVVAIGSPYGLGATVTSGIVSALNRAVSVSTSEGGSQGGQGGQLDPFGFGQQEQPQQQSSQATTYPAIQTDAAINPGNSGGPLTNLAGEVIGINSSIRTADSSSSSSAGGSIGLGFAIPISEVMPIVKQIEDGAKPTHARLGISVGSSTDGSNGAVVKSVESGGAGSKAGLKNGDVITKVDDHVIGTSDDLVATIRGHRPGQTVTLTIKRGGKTQTIEAKLGSDANTTAS